MFDIAIASGQIVGLDRSLNLYATAEIDAAGKLVTTSYVNAAQLLWMTTRAEIERLDIYITVAITRAKNIAGFDLEVGRSCSVTRCGEALRSTKVRIG